ncbi:hypothetical protein V501_05055 [Pseudogymnoascus sp. VKM F-4519 (FW-2642)]|nr:hypothetical protein V501_05055 [Pseudogymnoascus sp. VKM F-4519 (FW-2642)]
MPTINKRVHGIHGSRGITQIVVVDIETQELPDLVEIGMIVVIGRVDENVSVGNRGKEDEVVGEGVEEGNVVKEINNEVPVFPVVDDVWLAVLELLEPDTKVNVTVTEQADELDLEPVEELVWLAVLELPEPDIKLKVTVSAVN